MTEEEKEQARIPYEAAIQSIEMAMTQLVPDGLNCVICGDNDHQAFECYHNPVVAMRNCDGFRCFHCGKIYFGDDAKEHFGLKESELAKCFSATQSALQIDKLYLLNQVKTMAQELGALQSQNEKLKEQVDKDFDITIEAMMTKEQQEEIGVDNDVPHTRCTVLKLSRILSAYFDVKAENDRLKINLTEFKVLCDKVKLELADAEEKNAKMLAMLKALDSFNNGDTVEYCYFCGKEQDKAHCADCSLGNLIKEMEGK